MEQSEFVRWLERVLGDTPIDELVSPEIMAHVDRIHVDGEQRAWNFCKEDAREPFTVALRSLSKTMFVIGYDAGREQARIDSMFYGGSGLDLDDNGGSGDNGSDDDRPPPPHGLLPMG
jgi:hypothetical protein